jgi:diadenosine tetraphosphate (Ap4A) HIT family hydrolase
MDADSSPFLAAPREQHIASNELCFALRDAHPVSPGHALIVPWRPVKTWFEATREEWMAALDLMEQVKNALDEELAPDGYNVGFNAGRAAGQTVFHAHLHVIPRFTGDVDDPVGGVRHAVVGHGRYDAR